MSLKIITYPDKKLFEKSVEVKEFDDKLAKLLDEMYDVMIEANGIGLAAIQVAKPIRAVLINLANEEQVQDKADLIELINPKIIKQDGKQIYQEGCLSVPGYYEEVKRAQSIEVEYFDRFGKKKTIQADGLLAVAIQHECDHLDGHLFIEKISYNARKKFDKEYRKNKKR